MAKAQFYFEMVEANGRDIILIRDLNKSGMSVTNDIENVIRYIETLCDINAANFLIICQNMYKEWNVYDHKSEDFIFLNAPSVEDVIKKYTGIKVCQKVTNY